jgi:RND family efflux transporter MFP subunit
VASKSFKLLLPFLLIGSALVITLILIAGRPENVLAPPPERTAIIDVAEVTLQDLRIPIQAQGTVNPHRETVLVSEVAGKILSVSPSFNAGGYVSTGELLIKIDDRDYQANVLRARAAVESAESLLAQEKGRAEVAKNEWQKLPKNSQRSQAATDLYLRKPQLDTTKAQLLSAQADLQKAEDDLERTSIRAPYDAIIRKKRGDLGQYVTPGTAVADIFSVDFAEVRLAVSQSKLRYLELPEIGQQADTQKSTLVDLYTDVNGEVSHWTAHLQRTEGVFDERSRVLFAVARLEDPYALLVGDSKPLRMGTFVKANILGREMYDIAVLPRHVLRAGNFIWVVDEQMTLRNRKVQTLRTEGNELYVSNGLQTGDLVSLTKVSGALPGLKVRINKRVSTLRQSDSALEAADAPERKNPDPENTSDQSATDSMPSTDSPA